MNDLELVSIHIDTYDKMFAEWAMKVFGKATDDASAMKRFDKSIGLELDSNYEKENYLGFFVIDKRKCFLARLKYEF
jgi:hypothetical protein